MPVAVRLRSRRKHDFRDGKKDDMKVSERPLLDARLNTSRREELIDLTKVDVTTSSPMKLFCSWVRSPCKK